LLFVVVSLSLSLFSPPSSVCLFAFSFFLTQKPILFQLSSLSLSPSRPLGHFIRRPSLYALPAAPYFSPAKTKQTKQNKKKGSKQR
jgi:hypothetical protein